MDRKQLFDVIVIGGGQAGLAAGYFLEKTGLQYAIFDDQDQAGGAWLHTWDSLHLFSPARWSSLPGKIMEGGRDYYPYRDEVIQYLENYEENYGLNVLRPIAVHDVSKIDENFKLTTSRGTYFSRTVISATGTWQHPYIPKYPGQNQFKGEQIHSAHYKNPLWYAGKDVAVIGGGNSGAQILSEVSQVAENYMWITKTPPKFLPDEIDGRYLFNRATKIYHGKEQEKDQVSLGDIVMIPSVKEARDRGVLKSVSPFQKFTDNGVVWDDGTSKPLDSVIWCTGFKAALGHLKNLNIFDEDGKIPVKNCQSLKEKGLWLLGYGNWTGFASATLIGVGRYAYRAVNDIYNTFFKD